MKLVFATNNKNKVKEIKALLPDHIELLRLKDIGCSEEILETEMTLEGNARLKANYISNKYEHACFADDTGLEVDALKGEPGVFSARYAGKDASSEDNIKKLLSKLESISNRKAQFKTIIALNLKGKQYLFEGICKGEILGTKHGQKGFGYDPIFKPDSFEKSFAQMSLEEKGKISHRGLAMSKLIDFLKRYNG